MQFNTNTMLKALPSDVQHQLRSGVALSSYAQCVEELVLNAVDAGASCVAVRVDFLTKKLQVIDNGTGISKIDLIKLGERYHTSKCGTLQDLEEKLQHYGYRGEALASIRNMCYLLDVESRPRSKPFTYCKLFRGGVAEDVTESKTQRASIGTTVTVFDLFNSMPVRNKCINEALELERIKHRIEGIALIHPQISFSLKNEANGNKILQTHKANSIVGAFTHLFGTGKSRPLCEIQAEYSVFSIHGFISKEANTSKNLQFVYINSRLVLKSKIHKLINMYLTKTVVLKKKGFYSRPDAPAKWSPGISTEDVGPSKHTERQAIYIVNVQCPFSAYDITFDPSKTLVEFKDWESVLKCFEIAVKKLIERENLTAVITEQKLSPYIDKVTHAEVDSQDSQENDEEETQTEFESSVSRCSKEHTKSFGNTIATHDLSNSLQSEVIKRKKNVNDCISDKKKETQSPVLITDSPQVFIDNSPTVVISDSPPVLICENMLPFSSEGTSPPVLIQEKNESHNQTESVLSIDRDERPSANISDESDTENIPGGTLTEAYLQERANGKQIEKIRENIDKSQSLSDFFQVEEEPCDYDVMRKKSFQIGQSFSRKRRTQSKNSKKCCHVKVIKADTEPNISSSVDQLLKVSSESVSSEDDTLSSSRRRDKTFISLSSPSTSTCSEVSLGTKRVKISLLQRVKHKYKLLYHKRNSPLKSQVIKSISNKRINPTHKQYTKTKILNIPNIISHKTLKESYINGNKNFKADNKSNKSVSKRNIVPNQLEISFDEDPLSCVSGYEKDTSIQSSKPLLKVSGDCTNNKRLKYNDNNFSNSVTSETEVQSNSTNHMKSLKSVLSPLQRIRERLVAKSLSHKSSYVRQSPKKDFQCIQSFKKHADVSKHKNSSLKKKEVTKERTSRKSTVTPVSLCNKALERSEQDDFHSKNKNNDKHSYPNVPSSSVNRKEQSLIFDTFGNTEHVADASQFITHNNNSEVFMESSGMVNFDSSSSGEKNSNVSPTCEDCHFEASRPLHSKNSVKSNKESSSIKQLKSTYSNESSFFQTAENFNFDEALHNLQNIQEHVKDQEKQDTEQTTYNLSNEALTNTSKKTSRMENLVQSIEYMLSSNTIIMDTSIGSISNEMDIDKIASEPNYDTDLNKVDNSVAHRTDKHHCLSSCKSDISVFKEGSSIHKLKEDENNPKATGTTEMSENVNYIAISMDYDVQYVPVSNISPQENITGTDKKSQLKYSHIIDNDTPTSINSEGFEVIPADSIDEWKLNDQLLYKDTTNGIVVQTNKELLTLVQKDNVNIQATQTFVPADSTQKFSPHNGSQTFEADKSKQLLAKPGNNNDNTQASSSEKPQTTLQEPDVVHLMEKTTVDDVLLGLNWICRTDDKSGRKVYINTVTGNNSLNPPKLGDSNIKTKVIRNRHKAFLLTSNAAPYIDQPKARLKTNGENNIQLTRQQNEVIEELIQGYQEEDLVKWRTTYENSGSVTGSVTEMFKNWNNPMFYEPQPTAVDGELNGLSRSFQALQSTLQPVKFNKEMLSHTKVLNQFDRKFIACIMTDDDASALKESCKWLIVVDQHAAHERVRLEQFYQDVYEYKDGSGRRLKTCKINPALEVCTTEDTVRLMVAHTKYFCHIGIKFDVKQKDTVSVHSVPACFVWNKEEAINKPRDTSFLLRQLQLLIREQVDILEKTHGANITLPKTIHNVLCSRACHGAIKFGHALQHKECENLISMLKQCNLPFQCAHGRPTIMCLLDLNKIKSSQTKQMPKLWKLREAMEK